MTDGRRREQTSAHEESKRRGTLEHASPIDMVRLTRRFLIAVAIAALLFAVVLWGPWH